MHPDVFHGSETYPSGQGPVVTVGLFDGVHLGHQALVGRARQRADERGVPCLVYTFEPAPRDVLRPGNGIPRIQCLDHRLAHLGRAGAHQVVVERFTRELGAQGARWFAQEILGRRLGATAVVLGWNFRFGRGRQGDVDALQGWLDVPVEPYGPHLVDGAVVSSSAIRQAVRAGEVQRAAALLSRPHQVLGEVVAGEQRGRELGFPTANIRPGSSLLPADGVYAVRLEAPDLAARPAVANMGTRPTFDGSRERRLEVHVLDWQGDLYGASVRVHLIARLRAERHFSSARDLVRQIGQDITDARRCLG